jgi:hypothetical protein
MSGRQPPAVLVAVDSGIHAAIEAAAIEDGRSVSDWLSALARRELMVRRGLAALAVWEREHGEISGSEAADVERWVASLRSR